MELEDDSARIVHRAESGGSAHLWVIALIIGLWFISLVLYIPAMP